MFIQTNIICLLKFVLTYKVPLLLNSIAKIMTKDVITLPANKTVADAAQVMLQYDISSVVIVNPEKDVPFGLISPYDILELVMKKKSLDLSLKDYYKPLISIRENESIAEAGKRFYENQVHHLVVVNDSFQMIGILSTLDLAKYFN